MDGMGGTVSAASAITCTKNGAVTIDETTRRLHGARVVENERTSRSTIAMTQCNFAGGSAEVATDGSGGFRKAVPHPQQIHRATRASDV